MPKQAQKRQLKPLSPDQLNERFELLSDLIRGGRQTSGPFARVYSPEGYYVYNRLSNRIIAGIPKGWRTRGVIYLQRASIYNETLPRLASRSEVKTNVELQKEYLIAIGQKLAGASGKGIPRGLPDPETIPPKPGRCGVPDCFRPECQSISAAIGHHEEWIQSQHNARRTTDGTSTLSFDPRVWQEFQQIRVQPRSVQYDQRYAVQWTGTDLDDDAPF